MPNHRVDLLPLSPRSSAINESALSFPVRIDLPFGIPPPGLHYALLSAFHPLLGIAPEHCPLSLISHSEMPTRALIVPPIGWIIRPGSPHQVFALAQAHLAAFVRIESVGETAAKGLVVKRDPKEVDRAITLMRGVDGELVEIGQGRRGGGLLSDDACSRVVSRDNHVVEGLFESTVKGVRIQRPVE